MLLLTADLHHRCCAHGCRRQLRAAALLGPELDLPAAAAGLAGLQEALTLHLHSASAASAAAPAASHAHTVLADEQLAQLLTLADAAAQRFADLADAAVAAAADGAAAAGDAAAKKDNGWLQPLVTALETVLTFIEVGAGWVAMGTASGRAGQGPPGLWPMCSTWAWPAPCFAPAPSS